MERVNTLGDLYNESGDGVQKELLHELLQTAGHNFSSNRIDHFLADFSHLSNYKKIQRKKNGNKQYNIDRVGDCCRLRA